MMRTEAKETRSAARSSSSLWKRGYVGYGLILGFVLVLLYLMVSAQFNYSPHAYANPTTIKAADTVPAKRQRSRHEQDAASRGMEELGRKEVVEGHTEKSTARLQEEQDKGEQEWADKNPIEERSGNERNSDNWEEKHKAKEKDTVEFTEFGGGTDDFNNVAHTKPICDTSFGKYDICELDGDARARGGAAATVTLVSPRAPLREWTIKPYSRKYLDGLKAVKVKSVPSPEYAPQCTTRLNVPAMVIELGGFTGNYWHDFTDVLVPLFIGARRFNGEVQLLVVNLLPFWVDKYRKIFNQISRHEIVEFDKDDDGAIRCYPHVVIGYGSRKEFTIDPSLDSTGGGYTMVDFTKFLRQAYSLPRDRPIKLSKSPADRRPRMMILERTNSRKFMNLHEVIAAAEAAGFEVTIAGRPRASYDEFAREVNSFDVMLGVHGAGLTNCVFLPTGAVLVQIVPYGRLEEIARTDFGDPARDMGLRYIEYGIAAEESSLMDVFGKDHPMIKDPVAVHMSGWGNVAEWYLGKQDVHINMERFKPVLKQAMEHLR
ncbi:beta-1,2-xylosyltransferase XYXT1-like isoform X2 [Phragmites australis]|uniref:beta-1,2-xylosyltransferase XYXT1-like isoform X2 n=1 Tax=Phragmites australis TaxID=29695 RepID=UPI002D78FA9C|nr:beta-1,2-xylosyltransferase XYXT1-like isoform X2 [Phragmites australis]